MAWPYFEVNGKLVESTSQGNRQIRLYAMAKPQP